MKMYADAMEKDNPTWHNVSVKILEKELKECKKRAHSAINSQAERTET